MADTPEQQSEIYAGSEGASSVCEEERIRKLFQACDGNGDGYIDSQDLLAMCRELSLEHSVEELLRELGADEQGRVSYEEFLRCRLALRPEIDALHAEAQRKQQPTPEYLPTSSDNSLGATSGGKHESWEFDSGARDLSPEPHALQKLVEAAAAGPASSSGMFELANKLHLAALASLKGEILELSGRLHEAGQERELLEERLAQSQLAQAHAAAQAEERAEVAAQRYEERLTELHSVIAELRRKLDSQRAAVITEEEDLASEPGLSHEAEGSTTNLLGEEEETVEDGAASSSEGAGAAAAVPGQEAPPLASPPEEHSADRSGPCSLAEELALACRSLPLQTLRADGLPLLAAECCVAAVTAGLSVVPRDDMPVCKVAERVTLRRIDHPVTGSQLASLGVRHTPVAESLVSELQAADLAELGRGELAAQREQLWARLEHARAQGRVLALALEDSRGQAERLALLLGQHESNATALRLALGCSERATDAYDVLVALLESELGLLLVSCRSLGLAALEFAATEEAGGEESLDRSALLRGARDSRRSAESLARRTLARLDAGDDCPLHLPPPGEGGEWTQAEERRLREHILRLKAERGAVRATVLELQSWAPEAVPCSGGPGAGLASGLSLADACKLDLETAVLMQELMAVREDKAELRGRLRLLERDKAGLELRLGSQELQLQQLQAQIQELVGPGARDGGSGSPAAPGSAAEEPSEREARLRERVQGLVATLEKVSRNSELRHQQSADLINDLKRANGSLLQTLDRSKRKYQARVRKLEQRILDMAERHSLEVRALKQRLAALEEAAPAGPAHSSASETSL